MTTSNICRVLLKNETQWKGRKELDFDYYAPHLQHAETWTGHKGCVNRLNWSNNGSLLASGSDDAHLGIFQYSGMPPCRENGTIGAVKQAKVMFQTKHTKNILGVRWLGKEEAVVTGAMDGQVQVHPSPFDREDATVVYDPQSGRVKDIEADPSDPNTFWAALEDGTVRQYDRRQRPHGASSTRRDRHSSIFIRLPYHGMSHIKAMSLCLCPANNNLLAVGAGDKYVRVFDRRQVKLGCDKDTQANGVGQRAKATSPAMLFCPPHMLCQSSLRNYTTGVCFSPDGKSLLASYHGDHVYLFDTREGVIRGTYCLPSLGSIMGFEKEQEGLQQQPDKETFLLSSLELSDNISSREMHELICKQSNRLLQLFKSVGALLGRGGGKNWGVTQESQHVLLENLVDAFCKRSSALHHRNWRGDMYVALLDAYRARALVESEEVLDNSSSIPGSHRSHCVGGSVVPSICAIRAMISLGRNSEARNEAARCLLRYPGADDKAMVKEAMARLHEDDTGENENGEGEERETEHGVNGEEGRQTGGEVQEGHDRHFVQLAVEGLGSLVYSSSSDSSNDSSEDDTKEEDEKGFSDRLLTLLRSGEWQLTVTPARRQAAKRIDVVLAREVDEAIQWGAVLCSRYGLSSGFHGKLEDERAQMDSHRYLHKTSTHVVQHFIGALNVETDIKEATFFGRSGHIIAGSDDGRMWVWKASGDPLLAHHADDHILNCVRTHPIDPVIATSGIENNIKLWAPSFATRALTDEIWNLYEENQKLVERMMNFNDAISLHISLERLLASGIATSGNAVFIEPFTGVYNLRDIPEGRSGECTIL